MRVLATVPWTSSFAANDVSIDIELKYIADAQLLLLRNAPTTWRAS